MSTRTPSFYFIRKGQLVSSLLRRGGRGEVVYTVIFNVWRFSQCTVKAQALFGKLCDDLTRQDDSSWQLPKYRTMYCSAAIGYRPMIAEIADAQQSPGKLAERACNQAILAAMGSDDETLLAQRDKACAAVR